MRKLLALVLVIPLLVGISASGCGVLYRQPIVSAADFETALAVSGPTAQALMRDFERLGILTEVTGQTRGRIYEFKAYLDLFVS